MDNSIHHSETIFNSLAKINLADKFSRIAITHIITILISIFSIGYRGKTVDFETYSKCHRTTIGKQMGSRGFLQKLQNQVSF